MDTYKEWIEDPTTGDMLLIEHRIIKRQKPKYALSKKKKSLCPATPEGRSKGGINRAKNLTPERRREIARLGAKALWRK